MEPLILGGTIFFAFFFQALVGMGGGMISIPLLSLFFSPHFVIPFIGLFQLSTGLLVLLSWKEVDWPTVRASIAYLLFGAAIGAFLLGWMDPRVVRLLLGLFLLAELFRQRIFKGSFAIIPTAALVPLGSLTNGMFGIGGPLFVLALQQQDRPPKQFRATILALLFFSNCSRIPSLVIAGSMTLDVVNHFLWQIPVFLCALFLGHWASRYLKGRWYYQVIPLVIFFASVSLLGKAGLSFFTR